MHARTILIPACLAACIMLSGILRVLGAPEETPSHQQLMGTFQNGNYKDALQGFQKRVLLADADPMTVVQDFNYAVQCLRNLGRLHAIDGFREAAVRIHPANWRLLQAAAMSYIHVPHYGFLREETFHRGAARDSGRWVDGAERDRVRALQIMMQAVKASSHDSNRQRLSPLYQNLADILLLNRSGGLAWRLQQLTDLGTLPDYEEAPSRHGSGLPGAPVHQDGTPVFYEIPASFQDAENDGERWRWALARAAAAAPRHRLSVQMQIADFLRDQFGVQTVSGYHAHFDGAAGRETADVLAVQTLEDNETICRLATGVQRLRLPDALHFVRMYREIARDPSPSPCRATALEKLATIYENRMQFDKAASCWQEALRRFGSSTRRKQSLLQITGNWGRFEPTTPQAHQGSGTLTYRFRNGTSVRFEAHRIHIQTLLEDVKNYLASSPARLDLARINLDDVGYRLVRNHESRYLETQAASWEMQLTPRNKHLDRRITVETPLRKAGAYLVTADMKDGNTSRIMLWIHDTVIIRKPLDEGTLIYLADARSGNAVPKAHIEFFGYRQQRIQNKAAQVHVIRFAASSDDHGMAVIEKDRLNNRYNWLITATSDEGRLAYLGFTRLWSGDWRDASYRRTKVFVITDRPVYRPSQVVRFKVWLRRARYDLPDTSAYAHQTHQVLVRNPKQETIFQREFTTDAWGGLQGEFHLPKDAALGVYTIHLPAGRGGLSFRVEEYKKPEYTVEIKAPDAPVKLGETIKAVISARYYFGAPVRNARVKYKVQRYIHQTAWYPAGPWDWLYGPGYWWYAWDYAWYPGWRHWGCARPNPWWVHAYRDPPELVMENEVPMGADGTVEVAIDTSLAKRIHADRDHRYEITASVVDESRRTVVGTGSVLAARNAFQVYAWVDRGYYQQGDTVRAGFRARTPDGRPVQGSGTLLLYGIAYRDGKPVETVLEEWSLDTDEKGAADMQFVAARTGQYRLSYTVSDDKGNRIEGAYIFTVRGEGFGGEDFRFNDLELLSDRREYRVGEKTRLMINTNKSKATVLLFTRPNHGVYKRPIVIQRKGKSTVHALSITPADMPNFFVEAVTVADGKVHTVIKEIIVPPQKRILHVAVTPSSAIYKPGQRAGIKLRLTDADGAPFAGSMVVAVYDRALDYIAGGGNVPDIRAFFWKWRRRHHVNTHSNTQRWFHPILQTHETAMRNLGAFGGAVADFDRRRGAIERKGATARTEGAAGTGGRRSASMPQLAMAEADSAEATASQAGKRRGNRTAQTAGSGHAPPVIRTRFADTAYWNAAITTDADGQAEIEVVMPENLTGWKVKTWAMGHGTRVGESETTITTRKNLLLRLQAPRFFVEKDEIVLSANIHNYLDAAKTIAAVLEMDGGTLEPMDGTARTLRIAAGGEARVDWRVRAIHEGEAVIRMKALADEESDAMEMRFPVKVHGAEKTVAFSGAMGPDMNHAVIPLDIPVQRRIDTARLELRYSPSLAAAMVDALPYLAEYPYGCTEQTLNRFLPAVITQNMLLETGLDLEAIRNKRTNLNAQEIGDDRTRAGQWKRRAHNPVFDEARLRDMVRQGVNKLAAMQVRDGGWGWFSGWREQSHPHTTATVVHGLQMARENDVAVAPDVLARGVRWLQHYQSRQVQKLKNHPDGTSPYKVYADHLDAFVYMVLADADVLDNDMCEFLYRDRTHLSIYAKSLYGLALFRQKKQDKLGMILRNIRQYLEVDDENQTAFLKLPGTHAWWHWYGNAMETHACYLKLLARTSPEDPNTAGLVKYLVNQRRNAIYWQSTRATALCIEAMADYLRATGEHRPDMTVAIYMDGRQVKEERIETDTLFSYDNRFILEGDALASGRHTLEIRRTGRGPLYFNAYLSYFSLEDDIPKAGLELKVNRHYYQLTPRKSTAVVAGAHGQAVQQRIGKYTRRKIDNLSSLRSGALVEIELVIESKDDYTYLVVEDMKAAGFEPVDLRSGYQGGALGAYKELRDDKVAFFVRSLPHGRHSLSYRMRAEIPGSFSALPTRGYAMYAPELRGNSDAIRLVIEDQEPIP